ELTGFPEVLGGRVKTLHPAIFAGILSRRNLPEDIRDMEEHGFQPIDLVVVNLYPFRETIAREDVSFSQALEEIDIGGVSLIRAAAKNFAEVGAVVDPSDYAGLIKEMDNLQGGISNETRLMLAGKAFFHTARYDRWIADYLTRRFDSDQEEFPEILELTWEKAADLRYGENPHQRAALYREPIPLETSLLRACQFQGKELSFNNFLDLEAALQLVRNFRKPATVIIKHNNPCGVALGEDLREAFAKARETDPISAFGGVVGCNREMDAKTAKEISCHFLEAILAPSFSPEALEILRAKVNLRLLALPGLKEDSTSGAGYRRLLDLKQVSGGLLLQESDELSKEGEGRQVVTRRSPTPEEVQAMDFAWKVVAYVRSNAVAFVSGEQTLGIGAGQMSRVDSVKLAAAKACLPLEGSVLASDGFFPFPDGVEEAASVGATAIIQPGGSLRDSEVIAAADELKLAMVLTGKRHFRH
ncbi:MAG: bifunctional phosphoribosylaminoimidazolecarboxamide formyltransferase/IMP cyclohydrolase, partial [Candidatus Binatia bacterium]|nr:bifunctional phosphoribosylaminoimidazolecarboxamide formyltransferase/IMP cyclohydrolase [Candidatus Binatia bacterium]